MTLASDDAVIAVEIFEAIYTEEASIDSSLTVNVGSLSPYSRLSGSPGRISRGHPANAMRLRERVDKQSGVTSYWQNEQTTASVAQANINALNCTTGHP